jgi:dihydropteroate synthase
MKVKLVGVLNVTPNSFSDGGQFLDTAAALKQAEKLFADRADIIDMGAEATNPWAEPLTPEEEWARLEPILPELTKKFPGKISLDTYHPETAKRALKLGPVWLNDIMTFRDPQMVAIAARNQTMCIVSHAPLLAKTVKEVHESKIDDIKVVVNELIQQRKQLLEAGVKLQNIILDPGIGFGKTMRLNWQLLEFAKYVDGPVLVGFSRKRFLSTDPKTGKPLEDEQLRFTAKRNKEAAQVAVNANAAYMRVHEIKTYKGLLA